MKPFDTGGMLATPGMQNAPPTRLPLARRIVLHWAVRLLITWFGFGLMTAATVAGLQAPSVDISPIISVGLLAVCAVLTVVAVTRLIERRIAADIGLGVRRFGMDWLAPGAVSVISQGMQVAVQCNEDATFASARDFVAARDRNRSVGGLAFSPLFNEASLEICAG